MPRQQDRTSGDGINIRITMLNTYSSLVVLPSLVHILAMLYSSMRSNGPEVLFIHSSLFHNFLPLFQCFCYGNPDGPAAANTAELQQLVSV